MKNNTRIISADFLLRLANDDLSNDEILKLYFKYYFCQGRNIGDLRSDYFRLRTYRKDGNLQSEANYLNFKLLTREQIINAIERVKGVLNGFVKDVFDLEMQESSWD